MKAGESFTDRPRVTSAKHDILYSKARHVLNQRHIKRPWFNLNPFLEKTVDLADLDQFLPGDSKYIQPLKSLVLSESFHKDHPVETTELDIDAFFKYLHSDNWSHGCSIRVLEGQLLDQLLLGLYRMEHDGTAVRHTTHAFARNNRKRTGCYKQSTAESLGSIAETLIIEFAYFGRLTKEVPNEKSLDPFEYLHEPEPEEIETAEEEQSIPKLTKVQTETRRPRGSLYAMSLSVNSQGQPRPNWGPTGSLMAKHVQAISTVKAFQRRIAEKRQSVAGPTNAPIICSSPDRTKTTVISPLSSPENKRNSISTPPSRNRRTSCAPETTTSRRHSVASSPFVYSTSRRATKPTLDSRELLEVEEEKPVPKKKSLIGRIYELDFEDDNLYEEESNCSDEGSEFLVPVKKRAEFFGEEFYLSDKMDENGKPLTAKRKLQLNKLELQKKRKELQEMKAKQKEANKKTNILPPLSPLDLTEITSQDIKHETINMPDEMPTFEEFIQLLKEDEYYDPRYRNRIRLKSRRIAQRYYIAKGQHRSSVVYNFKTMPSEIQNFNSYRPSSRKSVANTTIRATPSTEARRSVELPSVRLPALQESGAGGLVRANDNLLPLVSCADLEHQSEEVKGVTDSESCKEHYLKNRKVNNTGTIEPTRKSSHLKPQSMHKSRSSSGSIRSIHSTKDLHNSGGKINTDKKPSALFQWDSPLNAESEATNSDNDEDDDDDKDHGVFDTKKLNLRYSIERLRKKRRSRTKKKPVFIEILAKYYNVQNALRVFQRDSPTKDKGSPGGLGKSGLGAMIFGKLRPKAKEKKESNSTVGKLKHFKFCDVKPKKTSSLDYLSRADFTKPDLDTFYMDLQESLQFFVVRREIVVSDIQTFYSALTSVTFTRKTCFQHKHTECNLV